MASDIDTDGERFAVDCMLGKLAKWLRILGFDAAFFRRIPDDDLIVLAREEGRILLSRDHGLLERAHHHPGLFVESEDWPEQVRQVMDVFGLWGRIRPYSRCTACNRVLKSLSKSRAKNLAAPFVLASSGKFALCPGCGRIYWEGTHRRDMEARLADLRRGKDPDAHSSG